MWVVRNYYHVSRRVLVNVQNVVALAFGTKVEILFHVELGPGDPNRSRSVTIRVASVSHLFTAAPTTSLLIKMNTADYVSLNEIYVHDPKLFKSKNLKGFVKTYKIDDKFLVKRGSVWFVCARWVQSNITSFVTKLDDVDHAKSKQFFQVQSTLEKYRVKSFNPVNYNMDSTCVKFFMQEGVRTPYFTKKGLLKIMVLFNDVDDKVFDWLDSLVYGGLKPQLENVGNVLEMVTMDHPPIIKKDNGRVRLSYHAYSVNAEDSVVDFRKVFDVKKEQHLDHNFADYECPVFRQIKLNFEKGLLEAQNAYEQKIKDLKHEKVVHHLKQELEKEKSLKDQAISLTQSFIPAQCKASRSPVIDGAKPEGILKPSKIR
jgi:hypothetical protein